MKKYLKLISIVTLLTILISTFPVSAFETEFKEFRGVWISTVYNLDYPSSKNVNVNTLKTEADEILDNCKDMGMTDIILQVRPSGDAFYPSDIYPWSAYLTGMQGLAPQNNFDPLEYWVKAAHKRGLKLHAWINPYRVTKGGDSEWNTLAPDNPAKMHPEWCVKYSPDGNYYLNPGIPEVRDLVIRGAVEIAENYNVDGIHLDDYFYPGANFNDSETFSMYSDGFTSLDDWRRNNVDILIEGLYDAIKSVDPSISFGVSPQGIWANKSTHPEGSATSGSQSYSHYADTRKWVKEGYLDYICPQVYWYIGQNNADYEVLANWWAETVKGTGVKLYMGIADYKANVTSPTDPWHSTFAIEDQLALNMTIPEISGEAHFRYKFLLSSKKLYNYYKNAYNNGVPKILSTTKTSDGQGKWIYYSNGNYRLKLQNNSYSLGWKKIDGSWFYFDKESSDMQTGWKKIDGYWYFFNGGGYMKTGWIKQGNKWYYLNTGGNMQTKWKKINDKWYYFLSDGVMAADTITPDGYRLGPDGAML